MTNQINYDDNIFYLQSLIKGLRTALHLDLDPEYFRDKLVEDIFFVDRTLQQIYETLGANTYLINRSDHLRELVRAKRAYCDFLDEAAKQESASASLLAGLSAKISSAREQHVRDIADIQGMMDGRTPTEEPKTIVSQDEYRFLFEEQESDE